MSLVRFERVTKSFGGKPVLDGISLRVEAGEKIGLIGRNGTGKTTIFRLITGELDPDSGTIERMRRSRVACLAQMPNVAPTDTVFDIVMATFRDLLDLERQLSTLEHQMAGGDESVHGRYSALQEEFAARGGYDFRVTVQRVLCGLGFTTDDFALPFQALSGGQRTRLMLVLVLLQDADLLLLDEPENHLDIQAQEWLEAFLQSCPKAAVIISHDRRLLDNVVSRVIEVERGQLAAYSGNYQFYARHKALLREQQQKAFDQQQEFIEKEQRWIERFRYKNTKASQVQSRIRRLEKLERVEAPLPDGSAASFHFGDVIRSGQWVIRAQDLAMAYGGLRLYDGLSIEVTRGERVGIIGSNGSGKTTLLRHLAGRLTPVEGSAVAGAKGTVVLGHKVRLGFYEQHHENLAQGIGQDHDLFTEIRNHRPDMTPEQVRTFMGRFLFVGDDVFKPLCALSGGELSRVAIAKLILSGANLLLLDEPTNHLDIASRETIEAALNGFPGTLIVVSHDRQLIDRLVDKLIVIDNGHAAVHQGNYSDYHWRLSQKAGGESFPAYSAQDAAPGERPQRFATGTDDALRIRKESVQKDRAARSAREKEVRKKRKQVEELERNIESVEEMIESLEARFAALDPTDFERAQALKQEYEGLKEDLQTMYGEWERLVIE